MSENEKLEIREAVETDFKFVVDLMDTALSPYYGGDHRAHAKRIFSTHISGGKDQLGFFSREQKMFIATINDTPIGMIHIVGKRQGTYKISPLIVSPQYQGKKGLGGILLQQAENYAQQHNARQIYCTVAEENRAALEFFLKKGYVAAGYSPSHYKQGITELMLYKYFVTPDFEENFDRLNISVLPCEEKHEPQVRRLLLNHLPESFEGIDENWVDSFFNGYKRRDSYDINLKYKLIFVAEDREKNVLGVAGATPKKGSPIKVMPFIATSQPAFVALLSDIPYLLKPYGRKLYIHISPNLSEILALQRKGWKLDAIMPEAYHESMVTQQWSSDLDHKDFMRQMRVKKSFFDLIKNGEKTLEVRVGYNNITNIQDGDFIRLTTFGESQVIFVNEIRQYKTFTEMLNKEDYQKIAPGFSKEKVLNLLKEIYPPEKEQLGVIVLDIKLSKIN